MLFNYFCWLKINFMNKVVLLLGGNLGDRMALIDEAQKSIEVFCGKIILASSLYESEAWGFDSSDKFLNKVVVINTEYSPYEILDKIQNIEKNMGRKRKDNKLIYESRPMDIDILFFNDEIINTDRLIIPHPKLHERLFTLKCLDEIMPDYIHPLLKNSIREIILMCDDKGKSWKYE